LINEIVSVINKNVVGKWSVLILHGAASRRWFNCSFGFVLAILAPCFSNKEGLVTRPKRDARLAHFGVTVFTAVAV